VIGHVRAYEKQLCEANEKLAKVDAEYTKVVRDHLDSLPEIPTELTDDEHRELGVLREKIAIARDRYDAYASSHAAGETTPQEDSE
jgi:hypothetical protein